MPDFLSLSGSWSSAGPHRLKSWFPDAKPLHSLLFLEAKPLNRSALKQGWKGLDSWDTYTASIYISDINNIDVNKPDTACLLGFIRIFPSFSPTENSAKNGLNGRKANKQKACNHLLQTRHMNLIDQTVCSQRKNQDLRLLPRPHPVLRMWKYISHKIPLYNLDSFTL